MSTASSPKGQLEMPGFNVPLNIDARSLHGFRNALDPEQLEGEYLDGALTTREITMMRIMNSITDKPGWDEKVFDDTITTKWRAELLQSGQDVSERMINWIMQELRWKAGLFAATRFVEVFDDGVVKSDGAISQDLRAALQRAVAPLENVPEEKRDYHPGSENTVVDLVHPSLFPVVYGRTRVLPDRVIGLDDCLDTVGQGELVPIPPAEEANSVDEANQRERYWRRIDNPPLYSTKFQWLPCEVELSENKECRIVSYINNAHPVEHRELYEVVGKILTRTIPLWEKSLTERPFGGERIRYHEVEFEGDVPEPEYPYNNRPEDFDEKEFDERHEAWMASRRIIQPEPPVRFEIKDQKEVVDLREHFPGQNLQVIVKLANIELTPEKPHYAGGTWHIEGQLNERIAASAIYYYDNENITSSTLSFRHRGMDRFDELNYEQDEHQFLQKVYGFPDDVDGWNGQCVTQELGGVECREGRLVTFPNTLQHRVSPFSLADSSKPGHRKILALFLVDPHRRIISSANVPPQREDWRSEKSGEQGGMSMEEAKAYRLELMEERGIKSERANEGFQTGNFSLCEH
ncbi:hypothetical protein BJY00DRAFT_300939 [Aspergillus carlsbadensis]|nr:hypothetical protein BJY00DRAFT_300939 [Aspergillus carlsbadensis]